MGTAAALSRAVWRRPAGCGGQTPPEGLTCSTVWAAEWPARPPPTTITAVLAIGGEETGRGKSARNLVNQISFTVQG